MIQSLVIKEKLEEYFKIEEEVSLNVFNQLALYIYQLETKNSNTDLYYLAKILDQENLIKLVSYYDGDILKMPTKDELRTCTLVALCFYLKEYKGWDWTEIKSFVNLPENNKELLSSISLGRKINNIKDSLNKDIRKLLKKVKIDNQGDLLKNFESIKEYLNE